MYDFVDKELEKLEIPKKYVRRELYGEMINHISVPSQCRCGECGWCHSYLKKGKVYIPAKMEERRIADKKYGFIHPCCTFPLSGLELEVPYSR